MNKQRPSTPGRWVDWSKYARCTELNCDASAGWPCYDPYPAIVSGRLLTNTIRTHPHRGRRLKGPQ
jgi:hypothetical protein